jgi:hypothetical protein
MMNVLNDAQVTRARKNIRERIVPLSEMAAFWEVDPVALNEAALGITHPHLPDPVTPGEILAAEPPLPVPSAEARRRREGLIDPALAIRPLERGDKRFCGVPGCGRDHSAYGYCEAHLRRVIRDGDPQVDVPIAIYRTPPEQNVCSEPGCGQPIIDRRAGQTYRGWGGRCRPCARRQRAHERKEQEEGREVIFA